jgi:hypothetical protein
VITMTDPTGFTQSSESHTLIKEFACEPGLVPDQHAQYMSPGLNIRPDHVEVEYRRQAEGAEWDITAAKVSGYRVLKSGKLSDVTRHTNRTYGQHAMSGWLVDLVKENRPAA